MPIDDVSSQPEINFLEHHIHIKVVAIHVYSMATFGRVYREPCIGNINGVICLKTNYEKKQFTVPENIPTPPPWGAGGSVRPKNLKKCMKLNWGCGGGGGGLTQCLFHSPCSDILITVVSFCLYLDSVECRLLTVPL